MFGVKAFRQRGHLILGVFQLQKSKKASVAGAWRRWGEEEEGVSSLTRPL